MKEKKCKKIKRICRERKSRELQREEDTEEMSGDGRFIAFFMLHASYSYRRERETGTEREIAERKKKKRVKSPGY
jgi:hypothetical protein